MTPGGDNRKGNRGIGALRANAAYHPSLHVPPTKMRASLDYTIIRTQFNLILIIVHFLSGEAACPNLRHIPSYQ